MAEVPAKASFVERVSATALAVRPVELLLTLLTFPFYVLGWIIGLVVVVVVLVVKAVKTGMVDARTRAALVPPATGAD